MDMRRRWVVAAGACLTAMMSQAADVAFYSFAEGQGGTDALGVALQNAVDVSVLGGSASLSKGSTATATFLDDVPGRYLYTNATWTAGSIYRSDVYRSIQTTWETNSSGTVTSYSTISFADLGARLAELDAWTVEFFFKFDDLRMVNYLKNVVFGDDEDIRVCLENKYSNGLNPSVRVFWGGVLTQQTSPSLSSNGAGGKAILPGLWHHLAVSYTRSSRTYTAILDYTHTGSAITCSGDRSATAPLKLANEATAARFAALRVTDRVLSANELMRASSMPPSDSLAETRFHWSFEAKAPGESLGTVQNDAPWSAIQDGDLSGQYAYAVDGQSPFMPLGNGVVEPNTYTYSDPEIGTLTMDGYASNVTDRAVSFLEATNGTMRANKVCAFLAVGPKDASSEIFGKGPAFRMTDTNLLTKADFTVETYWKPDMDGWLAILGEDAGNRYRTSIFGVKGNFRNDVPNKVTCSAAWNLSFNMDREDFNFQYVAAKPDGTFAENTVWHQMGDVYSSRCKDGRMHHYAVVYRVADADNGDSPTVRIYIDHVQRLLVTLPAPLVDFGAYFKDVNFSLGGQELNNHPMQGWFDEVRYTARALAPDEFLRLHAPAGMSIVFR